MKSLMSRKSVGNRNRINSDQNWLNVFHPEVICVNRDRKLVGSRRLIWNVLFR